MADTQTTFSFHRSIYLPDAVKAAAEQYGGYCESVDVQESETEVTVTLRGYDAGYGELFGDMFANHALFESIVRTRETLGGVAL